LIEASPGQIGRSLFLSGRHPFELPKIVVGIVAAKAAFAALLPALDLGSAIDRRGRPAYLTVADVVRPCEPAGT